MIRDQTQDRVVEVVAAVEDVDVQVAGREVAEHDEPRAERVVVRSTTAS